MMTTPGRAMSVAGSSEHEELRRSLRAFLSEYSSESEVRRLMVDEQGYDGKVWRAMADMLGLQGLAIPECFGGSGYTMVEQAIVLEEMGGALLCSPYLSTAVLAATALLESGDGDACARWLPGIVAGHVIATLAISEDGGIWDVGASTLDVDGTRGGHRLTGSRSFVTDGDVSDVIIVAARSDIGPSLFAVTRDAPGLRVTRMTSLDQTRRLARLDFDAVEAVLVGHDGAAAPVLDRVMSLAAIALAAEQVGGAQRCLDMAVEYATVRVQFGRPIGSFQAVKHRLADMALKVESARSAAYHGATCVVTGAAELPTTAHVAKAVCSEAFVEVATEMIQVHGGMGFTWDHPAHLYFKRARSTEQLFGSPYLHRDRLVGRLDLS